MATYRFAKIPAHGERIGQSGSAVGLENALESRGRAYGLAVQMPGATEVPTSALGDRVIRDPAA